MTQEEFISQNSKTSEYSRLQDRENQLTKEHDLIEMGILEIVTAYKKQITFYDDRPLRQKVVEAICKVYNEEIKNIRKLKDEI